MFKRRNKFWFFVLEGLGSLGCGFYGNYVYFLLRDHYGFSDLGNLTMSALGGLVFAVAAWNGGRFAQRRGYFTALRVGFTGLALSLAMAGVSPALGVQVAGLMAWNASMCFVWPALEALVSEGETTVTLTHKLGVYNVVWAACSAFSYFFGGAIYEHLGFHSIYWLPVGVFVFELLLVLWLAPAWRGVHHGAHIHAHPPEAVAFKQPINPKTFQRMAWLANPFACMAFNCLVALIPGLARELHLSPTASGLFCSVWFFARLASFIILWHWTGWHYRFRWMLAGFVCLLGTFATILLARDFWVLVVAQIGFGLAVGLMYYSSLFYSMDVGDTKGEHGGIHEAVMGAGNFVGPGVGAAALWLVPGMANAGTYAVSGLLVVGLVGVMRLRTKGISAPPQS